MIASVVKGSLTGLQRADRAPVGFHSETLEVARLSYEAWQSLQGHGAPESDAALSQWEAQSPRPATTSESTRRSLTINVTQVCNLHCAYCAAGGDGTYGNPVKRIDIEKTLPQLKFFIDRVPSGGSFQVVFVGGEPLLYPEGLRLLAEHVSGLCRERDVVAHFQVVTNGTLFTEKTIEVLAQLKADLTISLDGAPDIQDQQRPTRGGGSSSRLVLKGLELLFARKSELGSVGFSGVFGAKNLDLEAAYQFYRSYSPDWIDFVFDHTEKSAEVSAEFTTRMQSLTEMIWSQQGEKGLRLIKFYDSLFERLDQRVLMKNYCEAGKTHFVVDAQNNLTVCPWWTGKKEELVGHGTQIWEDRLVSYQADFVEKPDCQSCWARHLCGGGCMFIQKEMTGNKHVPDHKFCDRTRALLASGILYYEWARTGGDLDETPAQMDGQNAVG